jgi:DNA repair protein SbcC/Rad50
MKPERLEMAGFAPFRSATEIDFTGLDLFALTGPTGAGKSSVIDAITFALYGRVARYNKRAVEPVISLGAAEARVLFEFTVEGTHYTAARVVRRLPKGGATVAEARLESGGAVLASGADDVTRHVEQLLGLGLEHFNRSVVLPQGEFAAFLHDTPAGQQALVKALLDMGVLDDVRRLAGERAKTATALADSARNQLDHLADATAEAETQATKRMKELRALVQPVTDAEEEIKQAETAVAERGKDLQELQERRQLLKGVRVPANVPRLAEDLNSARERRDHAQATEAAALEALEATAAAGEGLLPRPELESRLQLRLQLIEVENKRDAIDLARLNEETEAAAELVARARSEAEEATSAWEEARTRHTAHALVIDLHAGDPCPVCRRPLDDEPDPPPADLEERQRAVERSRRALEEAQAHHRQAEKSRTEAGASHAACVETITDLETRLGGVPDFEELERLLEDRKRIDGEMAHREKALKEARAALRDAGTNLSSLETRARQAWDDYSSARDRLVPLGPPAAGHDDLAAAWTGLAEWAAAEAVRLDTRVGEAEEQIKIAQATLDERRSALLGLLDDAGVTGTGSASARLAAACATAEGDLQKIKDKREQRTRLEADLRGFEENTAVASALANHLKAPNFVGWFLSEALATLVEGANALLAELTHEAYSLVLDGGAIEVIDHRNADERRSVHSLSGGETFLVSLALALSLGEQLTSMSELGSSRLEAIFLDEGFGSLDAETLETVTAVVTELAAGGRVVGLVTHVKDLGDQVPVRFEVRPGPSGSTIERVDT